jgi:hypothetical protein
VLSSTYASIYVRAGRSGPPLRPPTLGCVHLRGVRSVTSPLIGGGGGRGGTWSALGKHRDGPALKGGEAGLGPVLSLSRMRSRRGTPIPIVLAPDGSNRYRRLKLLRRPTVSTLSLATVVALTALSLDNLDIGFVPPIDTFPPRYCKFKS